MLIEQLRALGVQPGGVLLVHTALSKVGSGPHELIEGLLTGFCVATARMPSPRMASTARRDGFMN